MTHRCLVCRGSQIVRLPLFHDVSFADFNVSSVSDSVESSRNYPCPECKGDAAPFVRIQAVTEMRDVISEAMPTINDAVRGGIARAIADRLLRDGLIAFEIGVPSYQSTPVRGTLHAVAPRNVATMQSRVEERQMHVAGLVVEEAQRQVQNWGSDFNWTSLTKDDAGRLIRESLSLVQKRFAEWKPWK